MWKIQEAESALFGYENKGNGSVENDPRFLTWAAGQKLTLLIGTENKGGRIDGKTSFVHVEFRPVRFREGWLETIPVRVPKRGQSWIYNV